MLGAIIAIIGGKFTDVFQDAVENSGLCRMIVQLNFDYRKYIQSHESGVVSGETAKPFSRKLTEAAVLLEDSKGKSLSRLDVALKIILGLAVTVSVLFFTSDLITQAFAYRISSTELKLLTPSFFSSIGLTIAYATVSFAVYMYGFRKRVQLKKEEILASKN